MNRTRVAIASFLTVFVVAGAAVAKYANDEEDMRKAVKSYNASYARCAPWMGSEEMLTVEDVKALNAVQDELGRPKMTPDGLRKLEVNSTCSDMTWELLMQRMLDFHLPRKPQVVTIPTVVIAADPTR